jgi:hypothetical protein
MTQAPILRHRAKDVAASSAENLAACEENDIPNFAVRIRAHSAAGPAIGQPPEVVERSRFAVWGRQERAGHGFTACVKSRFLLLILGGAAL